MDSQPAYSESIIFGALDASNRLSLMARGLRRSYQKGETIFSQGDEGTWLLVIEEGLVEVSIMLLSGRKSVLNHMEKGEILGEIALFDQAGRSADAVALTPVTGTVIHRQHVLDVLNNNTAAYHSIIQTLCSRVRNASEMFETQSLPSASSRLARCLLRVAKKWGRRNHDGSIHVEVAFTQSDLGDLAGLARENVNRHLQTWSQDGLIHFDKGDITLLDSDSLAELAEL
jgi:CRP-like cAMP-binding protein